MHGIRFPRGWRGIVVAGLALSSLGCREKNPDRAAPLASVSAGHSSAHQPSDGDTCLSDPSVPVGDQSEQRSVDPNTGRLVIRVGSSREETARSVTLAELLQHPDRYENQSLRVEGEVVGMCHHRRGWFALADADKGEPLRVLTAPAFLVPRDAMGKKGRAEGRLEYRELSAAARQHQESGHGLKVSSPRTVFLRATNAEFL